MLSIEPLAFVITLILGLAIGALVGWLASRPSQARLQAELERDRAVHPAAVESLVIGPSIEKSIAPLRNCRRRADALRPSVPRG